MALAPPGRLSSVSPFLPYIGTGWKSGQTFEYSIFVNPWNSAQLLMYYTGEQNGGHGGAIGLATASITDPTHWTDYGSNPVVTPPSDSQCRQCTTLYDPTNNIIRLYVSGDNANILCYTSTDGINFTVHNAGAPVFAPSQCLLPGCTNVSNWAVLRVSATEWYAYYCHRGSASGTLPSIRIATSSDGYTWTDHGESGWAKVPGTYYAQYLEGMNQILAMPDGKYLLITSAYDGVNWVSAWATASSPLGPFNPSTAPMFTPNPVRGTFDCDLAVNPSIFNLNGKWYLFYSGSGSHNSDYNNNYYSTGLAEF
jgi:hypothetical protein